MTNRKQGGRVRWRPILLPLVGGTVAPRAISHAEHVELSVVRNVRGSFVAARLSRDVEVLRSDRSRGSVSSPTASVARTVGPSSRLTSAQQKGGGRPGTRFISWVQVEITRMGVTR